MKKNGVEVCPGCGKHCPLGATRCKYGAAYFAKQQKAGEHQYKWEKHIEKYGLAWQLLHTVRIAKKSLCHAKRTEEQIFSALTAEERRTLSVLLQKLDTGKKIAV